jgi:hypothetical protein
MTARGLAPALVAVALVSCTGDRGGGPERTAEPPREIEWVFPDTPLGPIPVAISAPRPGREGERFPLLVALHGQGESRREPARGARGWLDDYRMTEALARLRRPPLREDDFLGMVSPERLAELNRSLERRPYRGLIVLCPYLPDRFRGEGQAEDARVLGEILAERLLPRARREIPGAGDAAGIDGVSLGGRAALLVGLSRPGIFRAVGALQPAIGDRDTSPLVELARRARAADPGIALRLLSSEDDRFLGATRRLSAAWREAAIDHRLDVVGGDHSYEFNRGPGAYEMLLFHDRALRGEPYLP